MSLESLRAEIDEIDRQIVKLLDRRARAAKKIGELKAYGGGPTFDPRREKHVYDNVVASTEGPLQPEHLRAIWREIVSACLAVQRPLRVAYFGPEGTFTHQAAVSKFGSSIDYVPEKTIPDVFASVAAGRADFGVVPIENSTEGPVNITADTLAETSLRIVSEIYLPIHLALLGRGEFGAVRRVYSHPHALAQARKFLQTRLPDAELVETATTVEAVRKAQADSHAAAIASRVAATVAPLEVLEDNIEDLPGNETRFFVIGRHAVGRSGRDKTTMMVSIKDEVGALHSMLGAFRAQGVNLTWIQSRPSRRKAWDYVFFLDCEGHIEDPALARVLETLQASSRHVQVLGSYPAAERA